MTDTPSKTASLVGLGLILVALIIAAVQGFGHGSLLGAIVAFAAVPASAVGMWHGMQQQQQTGLGIAIGVFVAALIVAGLLLVLWLVSLF